MKTESLIRLAYAEDHVAVRKGIISLISSSGAVRVDIEADNGKELISKIAKAETEPDICLLDINMPVMNGLETLIELKKRWPDIGVLVLTVSDLDIVIINMIINGANGYLLKTCKPEELMQAITSIYDKGAYFSGTFTQHYFQAVRNKELKLPHFTDNELAVLKKCCSNLSYSEMALEIGTTTRSVEGLRDSLFKKLQMNNRVSLAIFAIQTGVVQIDTPIFNGRKFLQSK